MFQRVAESVRFSFFFSTLSTFLLICGLAQGQVNAGTPSFSAYDTDPSGYTTINLQDLTVSLNVPVMTKSGTFPFQASLIGGQSYFSYSATIQPGILAQPITPIINGMLSPFGHTQVLAGTATSVTCPSGDGTGTATMYSGWYLLMADGTVHSLPASDRAYGGTNCSSTLTDQVIDGTGWTVTVVGGTYNAGTQAGVTVVSSGGLTIEIATAEIQDAQSTANKIYYSSQKFYDTLGTEVMTVNAGAAGQLGWFDSGGGNPTESQTLTNPTLKTSFGCSGKADYPATVYDGLTTNIAFPDSTNLVLAWEPNEVTSTDYTGRLAQITLRDGVSKVSFNYNPSNSGAPYNLNCTYLIPNSITRTTSDGTVSYTLAFASISGASDYKETDTRIDAGGNKTVYTFTGLTSTGNSSTYTQVLTEKQSYINQGTVSSPSYGTPTTMIYCYNSSSPTVANCPTAQVTVPISEVDVFTQPSGMSNYSRQQTQYDGGPGSSLAHYGNVTYSAQYDFGGSSPTSATTTVYGTSNGSGTCTAIGNNVNNKPCTVVTAMSGDTVASAQYSYDSHGNLLRTYLSPNGGSSFLSNTTANTYNANGTPSATYDLANNETTYNYSSSDYSDGSPTNYPFPTKITNVGTGLSTQYTYDATGGVTLTSIDPNSNVTHYCYAAGTSCSGAADPWWRTMSVTDPLSNQTFYTYTATSVESSLEFNSSSSIQNVITTNDGYGRPIEIQKQQGVGSSNYDTVSISRNFSGVQPTVFTSNPCSATLYPAAGSTCTSHGPTNTYDMFGRLVKSQQSGSNATDTITYNENDVLSVLTPAPSGENQKQVQKQYDGLGRLTSSCAVSSSATGNILCDQNVATSPTNGIRRDTTYSAATGSYTVTSSRHGPSGWQQRSVTTDGLGRIVQKSSPEGGTWNYYYDSSYSSCPSGYTGAPGQLEASVDPNGNVLCYQYDSLNRVKAINANGTACRGFWYDHATSVPTGVTIPTNGAGRMVEAYTWDCGSSLSTDEWFSYDLDGNITTQWEWTTHSTQYYKSVATYSGPVLTSLQLASPSLYTLTYGLDGEGRPVSINDSGTYISNNTTYYPSGQPNTTNLGASIYLDTDKDTYTYDPDTLLMTGWSFEIGATPAYETGTLTWNANNTLEQLQITDGFNSGGTQTLAYNSSLVAGTGYDDLGRLIGVSNSNGTVGSIWNQTYSYDSFNNLCKSSSGFVSWCPTGGYSQTTNHYLGSGYSYDSNGDVTNDGTNTYTWNQFAKMASVNGAGTNCASGGDCLIYDAFGRMVEYDASGTSAEIWYTQLGKNAYMNGASIGLANWPGPGGGTAQIVGNSTSLNYLHKDWLGNARITSSVTASTVISDMAYAPYGEIYDVFGSTGSIYKMFTGDTQDIISGMYNTPNRELQGSQQGRWLSPDPAGAGWNQYAYARSNPLSYVDPSGLFMLAPGFGGGGGDDGGGDPGAPGDPCFWYGICGGSPPPTGPPIGGGGGGGGGPQKNTCAGPNPPVPCRNAGNNGPTPCGLSPWEQVGLAGSAIINLNSAFEKIESAAAFGISTPATGPVGVTLAIGQALSAAGSLTTGLLQGTAAITGNSGIAGASTVASVFTGISGPITLAISGGNVEEAAMASTFEGIFTFGLSGAVSPVGVGSIADLVDNSADLVVPAQNPAGCQ